MPITEVQYRITDETGTAIFFTAYDPTSALEVRKAKGAPVSEYTITKRTVTYGDYEDVPNPLSN